MTFLPKADILSLEELDRAVQRLRAPGREEAAPYRRRAAGAAQHHEPLPLARRAFETGALNELTLTTNGSQLERHAEELKEAGVRRINVSLDTLDPKKFAAITRWGKLDQVLAGIGAAQRAGLAIKINAVALKGVNDDEFDRLIAWCGEAGLDLTLIEVMPMGDIGGGRAHRPVPAAVAGAGGGAAALDPRRDRLPHRRTGALLQSCARPAGGSASSRR